MDTNEKRELGKVFDALEAAHRFHVNRDTMNAAGHLAAQVRYSPLTSELEASLETLKRLLEAQG
jgi:hypothetical protein